MQHYKRAEDNVIFPWLGNNLNENKTIVDIGARKGSWYKNIARYFPKNEAHLFEPTPDIFEKTKRKYNKPTQNVYQVALSDQEGILDFHIDLDLGGWSGLTKQRDNGNYKTISVQVKTLDSYKFKNVGLIKIDVEGNEYKTLQGSTNTIVKHQPYIYFECADVHMKNYDNDANDIFKFFESVNYNILDLDLNVCTQEVFAKHTASKSSFYHNFIAQPK